MEAITIVIRSGLGMQVESVRPYLKPGTPIAIGRGGAVIAEVLEDFPAAHSLRLKEIRTQLGSEGHGHVRPRLDGTVMRCGGPGICKTCQKERLLLGIWQEADEAKPAQAAATRAGIFDVITGTANIPPQAAQDLPTPEEHAAQIERVAAALRDEQLRTNQVTEALSILDRWVEKAEHTDGYVGVVEIEAVEIVADELRRLRQPTHPIACKYNHWFSGDSDEAAFIREHGLCRACAEVDSMLCGSPAEGDEA